MNKVKITGIKNIIKNNEDIEKLGINIKKYLPINDKLTLVHRVIAQCIVSDDDVVKIDHVFKKFFYEIEMIKAYSNLDFSTIEKYIETDGYSDKLVEYYDMIKEYGIVDFIMDLIPAEEKVFIKNCIDEQINEEHITNNSLAGVLGKALNKLIEKLPTEEGMKEILFETLNNFKDIDPEKFQSITKLIDWNNGIQTKPKKAGG